MYFNSIINKSGIELLLVSIVSSLPLKPVCNKARRKDAHKKGMVSFPPVFLVN